MPTEAPPTDQSYRQLAAYLRLRPEASRFPAERVAEESGLPIELVRAVMDAPLVRQEPRRTAARGIAGELLRAGSSMSQRVERAMNQPVLFVLIVSIVGVLVMLAGWRLLPGGDTGRSYRLAFAGAAAVGVVLLHYLCYFHTGRVRVAFSGAGLVWILSVISFAVPLISEQTNFELSGQMFRALVALSLGLLLLAFLYLGIAVVLSVLGGYAKLRREERSRDKLTRQELLERLFRLEEQIRSSEPSSESRRQPWWRLSLPFGLNPYLAAFGLGAIATAAQTAFFVAAGVSIATDGDARSSPPMFMLLGAILSFVGLAAMALVAFLAGGLRTAVLCAVFYVAAQLLVSAIPIGQFGQATLSSRGPMEWIFFLCIPLVLAVAAGLGGRIEDRAARQRRIQENDAASLLAEMLDIQRRLNPQANTVFVMYVDVAGSTELKAGQDPLKVEYTFREYHRLINRTCAEFKGKVHASAGDDAVAEFNCAQDAFDAARRLQSQIGSFNAEANRLGKPLRIRIGLHTGVVPGELENIQFTRVIDIAAHVQEVAPVGGIALTRAVALDLPEERLAELRESVDGETVHLALDPMGTE